MKLLYKTLTYDYERTFFQLPPFCSLSISATCSLGDPRVTWMGWEAVSSASSVFFHQWAVQFCNQFYKMIMTVWIWYILDSKEQCKFWAWIWQNSIVWFDDGAWIPVYKSVIFSLPYLSKSAQFFCQRQTQVGLVYQWGHFWQEQRTLRNDSWRLTSANDWSYERFYLEVGGVSISVSPISSLVMELVVSRRQSSCFKTLW